MSFSYRIVVDILVVKNWSRISFCLFMTQPIEGGGTAGLEAPRLLGASRGGRGGHTEPMMGGFRKCPMNLTQFI